MTGRFFCTGWVVSPNSSRKPVGIAIPAGPPFAFPEKCEAPTLHGAPPQVKSSQFMPSQVGPQGGRRWLVFGLTDVSEAVRARDGSNVSRSDGGGGCSGRVGGGGGGGGREKECEKAEAEVSEAVRELELMVQWCEDNNVM